MRTEDWTPEYRSGYMKRLYQEQRAAFFAILGAACAGCGSADRLSIDHKDHTQKSFDVGKYWGKKKLALVLEELKKCQLLCFSCNKEKTKIDLREIGLEQGITHGTMYGWMKAKCPCSECQVAKRAWHDERNKKRRCGPGYGPRFMPV